MGAIFKPHALQNRENPLQLFIGEIENSFEGRVGGVTGLLIYAGLLRKGSFRLRVLRKFKFHERFVGCATGRFEVSGTSPVIYLPADIGGGRETKSVNRVSGVCLPFNCAPIEIKNPMAPFVFNHIFQKH